MKTVKELDELNIPSYYFVLHISIDNNDTGHSAMAMQAVVDYLEHARAESEEAVERAWKRVQVGFVLAEGLPTTPETRPTKTTPCFNQEEQNVVQVFKNKCSAYKVHCNSRLKFGKRTLVEWLDPQRFHDVEWQQAFLEALSNRKPWVIRGRSENSKLIHELSWGGRMFGAFTSKEVAVIETWIDSLDKPASFDAQVYYDFVGLKTPTKDTRGGITSSYPVLNPLPPLESLGLKALKNQSPLEVPQVSLGSVDLSQLLPLWFVSGCLLECFPNVPVRVSGNSGSAIVRILRAQYGFLEDDDGVAGMDELQRTNQGKAIGLVELGLEMSAIGGLGTPRSLVDVLAAADATVHPFITWLLDVSMRPIEYGDVLLGLTMAFVGLHASMAKDCRWMSKDAQTVLGDIVRREQKNLLICVNDLRHDEKRLTAFNFGLEKGKAGIDEIISS